jgi:CheY-like chemotaxis protein
MVSSNPGQQLPRILLIDDDSISLEVLSLVLEMNGFPVDCAEDGAKALESLKTPAAIPEVILMDTQMPGLSGLDLVRALRGCCEARIIAISGSEVGMEIRKATDGFLLKPIEIEALTALLKTWSASTAAEPSEWDAKPNFESDLSSLSAEAEPIIEPLIKPLINPAVLGKLKAMMPASAVMEIYMAVASDTTTRLVTLAAAMDAGDATEVARIAHTIKGGCAMVGFSVAAEAAARLEISNRSETWPKELLQLHFALDKLQSMLGDGLP